MPSLSLSTIALLKKPTAAINDTDVIAVMNWIIIDRSALPVVFHCQLHAAINNSIHIKLLAIKKDIPSLLAYLVSAAYLFWIRLRLTYFVFFSTTYITSLRWIRYGITAFLFSKKFKNKGNEERNDCSQ